MRNVSEACHGMATQNMTIGIRQHKTLVGNKQERGWTLFNYFINKNMKKPKYNIWDIVYTTLYDKDWIINTKHITWMWIITGKHIEDYTRYFVNGERYFDNRLLTTKEFKSFKAVNKEKY